MKDKVALVAGASSGIGAATAEMLAAEGVIVAAVARRADRLAELVQRIDSAGGRAAAFAADIAKEPQAFEVTQRVLSLYGRIDILINSAGIIRPGAVATADPAQWREMIDINLLAAMYTSRAVLQDMKSRGDGHIINVSSTAARLIGAMHSGYVASKHAVNAFTEAMRQEVASFGIRVTIVEPGSTATEVGDSIPNAEHRAFIKHHVAKEGTLRPEDVAGAILYALRQPRNVNVRELWIAPTSALH